MNQLPEGHSFSYEHFAQQPFYRQVDGALLQKAPIASRIIDLATGTGAVIEQLLQMGKIRRPCQVVGVDLDMNGLKIARDRLGHEREGKISVVQAAVEALPISDGWCELVTFCNSIHLTDVPRAFREVHRVLAPGGTLLVNTAYEKTEAYPGSTARIWGTMVSLARRELQTNHGYGDIPRPVDLMACTKDDYRELATAAGLQNVHVEFYPALMDRNAMKAICMYEEFARGSLPGVPVELSTSALVASVDAVFERFKIESVPRNWMLLTAEKA